ncbi:MAG TPA: DUF4148 domain-containing protein [Paraburkholderia sp.]|nr:DUF4148 domain-containing protein [Paraburkholderia sp.]
MKLTIPVVVSLTVLAAPAVSFAQSDTGPTRAQVQAELVQLESAGYRLNEDHNTYPVAIQAASARVAAQDAATSGVGGVVSGSSGAGALAAIVPATSEGMKSIYFGH